MWRRWKAEKKKKTVIPKRSKRKGTSIERYLCRCARGRQAAETGIYRLVPNIAVGR